jgi:desulfoferrodoxin-like iron-binding protein
MANQSGKRYVCATCGTEMLVTKAGEGTLTCCGAEMQIRGAVPAASAQQPAQK